MSAITCSHCHTTITGEGCTDVTTGVDEPPRAPRTGDLVVCPHCVGVSIIGFDGHTLLALTPAHEARLPLSSRLTLQALRGRVQ